MNIQLATLPQVMRVACHVGGMEAVRALSEAFGGRQMKIPAKERCGDNHPLVAAAGRDVAHAICAEWGGQLIEFPIGGSALNVWLAAALFAEGKSLNQVQKELRISFRHARRLKKLVARGAVAARPEPRKKGDPRQIDIEDLLKPSGR